MHIQVNDTDTALEESASLATAVALLGLNDLKGIAVAVNGQVIPATQWNNWELKQGDRLLIIHATQGG